MEKTANKKINKWARGVILGSLVLIILILMLPDPESSSLAGEAKDYKQVSYSDTSIGNRARGQVWIIAPDALSKEDRAATVWQAAQDLRKNYNADLMQVFLLPHERFEGYGIHYATALYVPDGCGISGQNCGGDVWNIRSTERSIDEHDIQVWISWQDSAHEFTDQSSGIINEDALAAELADSFGLSQDEILNSMNAANVIVLSLEDIPMGN